MRHRRKKFTTGKKSGSAIALQRSLAVSLIVNEKISTTYKKAKIAIPLVEKAIRLSRDNNLTIKRRMNTLIGNKEAEKKLLKELGKKYKDRSGGYVRSIKIGRRQGDNANMVMLELV